MSESKEPPRLPDVVDEAGPSPSWLPWLGFGLLCLCAMLIAARQVVGEKRGGDAPPAELAAGADEAAAAGAGAPPAAKPEPAAAQR
jgi:hypothetical protein